jgi:hypothetical protein
VGLVLGIATLVVLDFGATIARGCRRLRSVPKFWRPTGQEAARDRFDFV